MEQEAKSIPIGRKADELNRGARASREARPRATSDHARLAATIVDQMLFRIFPISWLKSYFVKPVVIIINVRLYTDKITKNIL